MSAEQEVVMSKSARQRAAKKARDAKAAEEAAEAAAAEAAKAAPAPKGKAKAKAEPKAEAKAKVAPKAEAKAKAAQEAAPKAAGKAKAAAKATAAPVAEAPKAEAKSKSAAKKARQAKAAEEAVATVPEEEVPDWVQIDDGTGGDWEEASGLNKKQEAAKKRKEAKEAAEKAEAAAAAKALKDAEIAAAKAAKAATKKGPQTKDQQLAADLAKIDADYAQAKLDAAKARAAGVAVAPGKGEGKGKPEPEPVVDDGSISVSISIPEGKIGRIIGPKGANIAFIKEKTGIKNIDTQADVCTIIGQPEDVPKAEAAIKELIEKGYMSISYDNFKGDQIKVPSTSIPNIIGKGGAIIQVIKKELQVEIDVEPTPKVAEGAKRVVTQVKVSIAGELDNVEKAKECIQSIVQFSHHEITHPGYSHAELEVEEYKYRFLIGKGGSEMRHIQNSFHVQVNIPRDGNKDDKVVVVGETLAVERAVKYITKVLEEADKPQGRDKPEEIVGDKWDKDEGPQEAWMSAYMYKRK